MVFLDLIVGYVKFLARLPHVQKHRRGEVSSPSLEHTLSVNSGWDGMRKGIVIGRGDPAPTCGAKNFTYPLEDQRHLVVEIHICRRGF